MLGRFDGTGGAADDNDVAPPAIGRHAKPLYDRAQADIETTASIEHEEQTRSTVTAARRVDPGTAALTDEVFETPASSTPQRLRPRLVAIAASAGGLHAIGAVLSTMPADFPTPIVVVQHLAPHHPSHMASIMARQTALAVKQARDGELVRPGVVYIAPPDRHLLVNADGALTLAETEMVHFLRPSADLMFESAAAAYGPALLATVLTGTGEDGAMGVRAVKKMGGTVIVQDEATAEFGGMPHAAIGTGAVDCVLALEEIGPALVKAVREAVP